MRLDDNTSFPSGFTIERRLERKNKSTVFGVPVVNVQQRHFPSAGLRDQWFVSARGNKAG